MKKAILMMTFGSPEEITFEGVADFFTNIRRGVRPQDHEIQTFSTAIPYAMRSDKFFFITSPLGNLNSIVPSILNITLSKPNP
ncbi:ferrochelatase [Streptococcus pneumoniae]|nr:ferrochelatase [Streptococcus pneumoniae]